MENVSFSITNFEGPLDLLLHLVAKRRMSLYDIRINELIDKYLETIGELSESELDGASEFIEMAARLVEMKSLALLPRSEEESRKLQRELVGQLIEYSLCKQAAVILSEASKDIYVAVREPQKLEMQPIIDRSGELVRLAEAYSGLLERVRFNSHPKVEALEEIVVAPVVSVSSRVIGILRGLRKGRIKSVDRLVAECKSRSELVATFLGILELIRAGRVCVGADGSIEEKARAAV